MFAAVCVPAGRQQEQEIEGQQIVLLTTYLKKQSS